MKIILEELGAVGQLELFRVQLAERLRCDVSRIEIAQLDGAPEDREKRILVLEMLPIDDQHVGIKKTSKLFVVDVAYDVLNTMANEIAAEREQVQFAEVDLQGTFTVKVDSIRQMESVISGDPDKIGGINA